MAVAGPEGQGRGQPACVTAQRKEVWTDCCKLWAGHSAIHALLS